MKKRAISFFFSLTISVAAQPAYAQLRTGAPLTVVDEISPLLQSESFKSDSSTSDNLLQMPPPQVNDTLNFSFPSEKNLLTIGSQKLHPIRLEATYNQAINLEAALQQALSANLPIKISADFYRSRRALFWGSTGRFLPDLSMTYRNQSIYSAGDRLATTKTGNTTLTWAYFQGGKVLFGAVGGYYTSKAAKNDYKTSINDVLLETYRRYNDVLYNQALLQIRIKSLETSRANLKLTIQQFNAGTGTKFAVMQSETQLALDAQNLVKQQIATRQAAIALSVTLNSPIDTNLLPAETRMGKLFIIDPHTTAGQWASLAIANRPELKSLMAQRLAARAAIAQVANPLLPVGQIFVSPGNTTVNSPAGNSTGSTGSAGVNLSTTGSGASSVNVGGVVGRSVTLGTTLTWNLGGLGVPDLANIESNRMLARRVMSQYNQQALLIEQEVHNAFLELQGAEQQIDIAEVNVRASREGLRLASSRLRLGNGTNLELIQAQQSYVQALSSQIQAFIDFRNAQAKVLRNTGTISISSLTKEFKTPTSSNSRNPQM